MVTTIVTPPWLAWQLRKVAAREAAAAAQRAKPADGDSAPATSEDG